MKYVSPNGTGWRKSKIISRPSSNLDAQIVHTVFDIVWAFAILVAREVDSSVSIPRRENKDRI